MKYLLKLKIDYCVGILLFVSQVFKLFLWKSFKNFIMASLEHLPKSLPIHTAHLVLAYAEPICDLCYPAETMLGDEPPSYDKCNRCVCMGCSYSSPGWIKSDGKTGWMHCNDC